EHMDKADASEVLQTAVATLSFPRFRWWTQLLFQRCQWAGSPPRFAVSNGRMRFRPLLALLLVLTAGHLIAQQREFRFDDARPLGQAASDLETAYGWIVTYEDVPVFGADAKDVTAEVRKDHDAKATNRIVVPNGSPFGFIVDESEARQPGQVSMGK